MSDALRKSNVSISHPLWEATGDSAAAKELFPLVYKKLHSLAQRWFRSQPANHTLQPTALVHEAYLRLAEKSSRWHDRAHFLAIAAIAMRQILVSHARRRKALKRGIGWHRVTLHDIADAPATLDVDLEVLEEALQKLERLNQRQSHIVELRFFGGLTVEQVAQHLSMSPRTVTLDWRMARAWLLLELGDRKSP